MPSVYDQLKLMRGQPARLIIPIGAATGFNGMIADIAPAGTDNSDAGVSTTANDDVLVTLKLNRTAV